MFAKRLYAIFVGLLFLSVALACPVSAQLEEVEPGVYHMEFRGEINEDVFNFDELRNLPENRRPSDFEIVMDGGRPALRMVGQFQNRVFINEPTFQDFVLETEIKKGRGNFAGVVVRDHWRVYLQMRRALAINTDEPGYAQGLRYQSSEAFPGYNKLKIICAGPVMRIYVNDKHIVTHEIIEREGRIGFYAHGNGEGFYRNLRVSRNVPGYAYLSVKPAAPEDALIFGPDEDVELSFELVKNSDEEQVVSLAAFITNWDGDALAEQQRREVAVAPGKSVISLNMGRVPEGFHRVKYEAVAGEDNLAEVDDLPLAIQRKGTANFEAPKIPLAPYSKYMNRREPIYQNTYAHGIAKVLKDNHFNAIVADPSFTRDMLDIFYTYGVAVITRSAAFMDHPAVIASLLSDEPKPDEIEELKARTDALIEEHGKPVTTCMIGEQIGLRVPNDPMRYWEAMNAQLRTFRWYGIKKSYYDLEFPMRYRSGNLPFEAVCRIMETSSDSPWWFVAPSFGGMQHEAYFQNPTPEQMRGLMHLPLAYGVDGILFYTLQRERDAWSAFVEQKSLQPHDGKLEAAAEVNKIINKHADLLLSLRGAAGLDIRCYHPSISPIPRMDPDDNRYVHVVNKSSTEQIDARLKLWDDIWIWEGAFDVFADEEIEVQPRDEKGFVGITVPLRPGEGKLIRVEARGRN